VTVDEDGELGEEEDERNHNDGVVGKVRLEGSTVRESGAVDTLNLGGAVETEVGEADRPPDEETGDGGHIGEPAVQGKWLTTETGGRKKGEERTIRRPRQRNQLQRPCRRGARKRHQR
jgi:hypothetical protein